MSFESDLAAYMKQAGIQAQIKAHIKKHGGFGGAADEAAVLTYAREAVSAIIASLPPSLAISIKEDDLVIGPVHINGDGDYQVNLNWVEKAVWRESLYDEEYPEGLENVVALFSHGSKPSKGMVAGLWYPYKLRKSHSHWLFARDVFIPAGSWLRPDSFLKDAVEAYNHAHAKDGVKLIMPDEYYPSRF